MSVTYYAAKKMKVGGVWVEPGTEIDVTGYRQGAITALLRSGDISTSAFPLPNEESKWDVLRSTGEAVEYSHDGYVEGVEVVSTPTNITDEAPDASWFGSGVNIFVYEVVEPKDTWIDLQAPSEEWSEMYVFDADPSVPGATEWGVTEWIELIPGSRRPIFFPANEPRYISVHHWDWDTAVHSFDFGPTLASLAVKKSHIKIAREEMALFGNDVGGLHSFAGGSGNVATGEGSFVAGMRNKATGDHSTAFGSGNTASGNKTFAVGYNNIVSGAESVAEGFVTVAEGRYSHASGMKTRTKADASFTFGDASESRVRAGIAISGGKFGTPWLEFYGNAQTQIFVANSNGSSAVRSNSSYYTVPDNFVALVSARVLSQDVTGTEVKAWDIKTVLTTHTVPGQFIGSLNKTVIAETAGASTWDIGINLSSFNWLRITPENLASNAKTVAYVELTEIGPDDFGVV